MKKTRYFLFALIIISSCEHETLLPYIYKYSDVEMVFFISCYSEEGKLLNQFDIGSIVVDCESYEKLEADYLSVKWQNGTYHLIEVNYTTRLNEERKTVNIGLRVDQVSMTGKLQVLDLEADRMGLTCDWLGSYCNIVLNSVNGVYMRAEKISRLNADLQLTGTELIEIPSDHRRKLVTSNGSIVYVMTDERTTLENLLICEPSGERIARFEMIDIQVIVELPNSGRFIVTGIDVHGVYQLILLSPTLGLIQTRELEKEIQLSSYGYDPIDETLLINRNNKSSSKIQFIDCLTLLQSDYSLSLSDYVISSMREEVTHRVKKVLGGGFVDWKKRTYFSKEWNYISSGWTCSPEEWEVPNDNIPIISIMNPLNYFYVDYYNEELRLIGYRIEPK